MSSIIMEGDEYILSSFDKTLLNVEKMLFPTTSFFHHHASVTGIRGWLQPREAKWLFDQAKKIDIRGDIVEVGSAWGKSTVCLGLGIRISGNGHIYAVDPHIGGKGFREQLGDKKEEFTSLDGFKSNIKRFGVEDVIIPVVAKSEDAVKAWSGEKIRLLFVDGWHTYEAAKHDILAWSEYVIEGGVIAVHDYGTSKEVQMAVYDALDELNLLHKDLKFVNKNLVYFLKK